jgi:hypothetical protein
MIQRGIVERQRDIDAAVYIQLFVESCYGARGAKTKLLKDKTNDI